MINIAVKVQLLKPKKKFNIVKWITSVNLRSQIQSEI